MLQLFRKIVRLSGIGFVLLAGSVWLAACDAGRHDSTPPDKLQAEEELQKQSGGPPNILLIVLDDFGYNDLGVNGNPNAPTPNLNTIAEQGTRYTRHYADASCSVARAALLTGTYPAKFGFRPTHLGLSSDTPTIATQLRQAGYSTYHVGKWHVGNPTLEQSPTALGFDDWFGFLLQQELRGVSRDGVNYAAPTYRNPFLRAGDTEPVRHHGHLTDLLRDKAVAQIHAHAEAATPWFLNVWFFAPHAPVQPAKRFLQQHPDTPQGRYYALLQQLDSAVGEILSALADSGQRENTLVVVVSDNGGAAKMADSNAPFFGKKTQLSEGGLRTPLLIRWPGHVGAGRVTDEVVSLYDLMPTVLKAAAAQIPDDAIGRDLLAEKLPPGPQLFWEYSNSVNAVWSTLSLDGRWRYTTGTWVEPTLNDLTADPAGAGNVLGANPDIAQRLVKEYLQWRDEQRRIVATTHPLSPSDEVQGALRITGQNVQRTPGYRGFTFAIAVTPSAAVAPAESEKMLQTIVHQEERWGLYHHASGLQLSLLGEQISLPALVAGRCSEVVVTSHFAFSPIMPDTNWSLLEVFINGAKVASVRDENPTPNYSGYSNATFVGQRPDGTHVFRGRLGQPVILNERVKEGAEASDIGDTLTGLPALCAAEA